MLSTLKVINEVMKLLNNIEVHKHVYIIIIMLDDIKKLQFQKRE